MKARVQSLHLLLNGEKLIAVWRRSAFDAEYRDHLVKVSVVAVPNDDDDENEQRKLPQRWSKDSFDHWLNSGGNSDLGQVEAREDDGYYFWANWLETNRGLVPVLDPEVFGAPHKWRLKIELTEEEREKVFVISEPSSETSVFVYYLVSEAVIHFLLFFDRTKKMPQLIKTELRLEDVPKWLQEKIATIVEEKSPQAALRRMEVLKDRLGKLLKRS